MPIIALKEHFATPELQAAWTHIPEAERDPMAALSAAELDAKLHDLGEERHGSAPPCPRAGIARRASEH